MPSSLPVELKARLDSRPLARLDQAISATVAITGRSATEAINRAALRFTKSAKSRAKPSKKWRKIVKNPQWTRGGNELGWAVQVYRQLGKVLVPTTGYGAGGFPARLGQRGLKPTKTRRPELAQISRRGLAKSSWGWIGRKIGSKTIAGTRTISAQVQSFAKKFTRVLKQPLRIKLTNLVMYMQKAYPAIVSRALSAASNSLIGELNRKYPKKLRKIWG